MPTDPTSTKTTGRRARILRVVRIGARVLAFTSLAVVLVAVTLLALPASRNAGLRRALDAAGEALPGTLTADARWPGLGRIEIRSLRWEVDGALVARAAHVDLDVALGALTSRDAVVREVVLRDAWADVDAIARAMADSTATSTSDTTAAASGELSIPWLREGSIEGLPSFALETVELDDVTVVTTAATVEVNEVSLRVDARPDRTEIARLDVDVATPEYGRLRGGLSLAADDSLRAQFDVWDWTPPGEDTAPSRDSAPGLAIALPPDLVPRVLDGDLDVVPVAAHGAVFVDFPVDLRLATTWDPAGDVRVGTRLRVPRAPTWLPPFLADADSTTRALVDGLLRDWPPPEQTYGVDATAAANVRGSDVTSMRADVRADLPGPADLVPTLDASQGRGMEIDLHVEPEGERGLRGSFDLDAPGWARVIAHGAHWDGDRGVRVDSVAVRAPGLDLDAGGSFDGTDVDATVAVDARLADLGARLREALGDGPWNDVAAVVRADASVRGTLPRPSVDVTLDAGTPDAPRALRLRATHVPDSVDVALDLDVAGIRPLLPDSSAAALDASTIETARVRLQGRYDLADTSAVARLDLRAEGEEARLDLAGRFRGAARGRFGARIDTLRAAWGPLDLASARSLDVAVDVADSTVDVRGFVLEGSLGRIEIDGDAEAARAKGRVLVDLDVGRLREILPDSLSAPLDASTVRTLRLEVDADYDLVARRGDARVQLQGTADEGMARIAASIDAELPRRLAARVDTLQVQWRDEDVRAATPLSVDADLDAMTVLLEGLDLRSELGTLRGRARADSSSAEGNLELDLAIAREKLLGWRPDLDASLPAGDSLRVAVDVELGGTARAPRADIEGGVVMTGTDQGDLAARFRGGYDESRQVTLRFDVREGETSWLDAEARVPVDLTLDPPTAALRPEDDFDVSVKTPTLDLDEVGRRAKAPFDLDGDLTVEFRAVGPLATMELTGSVESDRARVDLPDGSWLETATSIRLRGDARAPRVDGAVTVSSGLVLLPEVPPSRLPTDGEALLWEAAARADSAAMDSTSVTPLDTLTLPLPDVTMTLDVPGGVRVRGHGLDVEVRGNVEAVVEDGVPGLSGGLQVWRGRLELLGRRFQVETGTVTFDPDQVEPDPTLDIRLATTLEGTRYTVDVTGTATSPRLALGSDPPMPEGDIVSALLFGRPLDQLDEGQSQLLAQRTSEVAAAYGARVLSQRIGQRLGVDILSIEPGTDGGAASLIVGQYLSPDVIVQYEQVLEDGAAALVRLEYAITRWLRVETTASQGEHSGVELEWRRDY